MNARVGLRFGSVGAAVACALLVACGGGGGGGGGSTPAVPTAAPTATIAPTTQTTNAPLSTGATTPVSFGGVSNGTTNVITSATFTVPAVSAASTASIALTASAPTGVPTPSARSMSKTSVVTHKPSTLGVTATPIAYLAVTFSAAVSFSSTPALTIALPSAPSGNCYIVFYDSSQVIGPGWQEVTGPINCAATMSFPSVAVSPPIPFAANVKYVFAIVTTGSVTIPTATPSSSPTSSPTVGPTANPTGFGSPLPNVTAPPAHGGFVGWSPYQVATAFKFPVQSGYDGAGQTIAIIGDNPPMQSDLDTYVSQFQVPRRGSYNVVSINGVNTADSGGRGEATLDVETIMALAPGANIEFYSIKDLQGSSFYAAEQYSLTDPNHPSVMSISFGGCEDQSITNDHLLYAQGAAKGIAYTASSGDQGDACYYGTDASNNEIDYYGVNSPASDPSVIGVGGNENWTGTALAPLANPTVWNDDTFFSGQGASGSGLSTVFTSASTAQAGTPGLMAGGRNVPDISFPAEGVTLRLNGAWAVFGGTSWSAPIAGALMAEIYQMCPALVGGTTQNPAAIFYKSAYNATTFVDITNGNNAWKTINTGAGAPPVGQSWTATAGYDPASGLGLPMGMPVEASICPNGTPVTGAGRVSAQAMTQGYGPSQDVNLLNAVRTVRMSDVGERGASDETSIWLTLRNTATIAQDEQTVTNALQAAGIRVTKTYPNHVLIEASGPASAINAYFNTSMHNISEGSYGIRYANVKPMTVPAAIAPFVNGALGNNLVLRKALHHRMF